MKVEVAGLTIAKVREALARGEYRAADLVAGYLARIGEENPGLNAYLEVFDDVLEQAALVDRRLAAGEKLALPAVPLAVKDNILIKGRLCSAASRMLANYRAAYDATAIARLREAGAIFLGRTNLDEFAMGSSTENSAFGPTKNPHDPGRVPGGSSGGSAAAVAADLCLVALGSDTGGSVRQPASFCGVVGLKPTYGAVSRSGLIAMASSLDQIGAIARTVEDAELIFEAISGKDPLDSTTFDVDRGAGAPAENQVSRLGVPYHFLKGVAVDVLDNFEQSVKKLERFGYSVVEIELPDLQYSLACYYIVMPAEASSNLARYDGIRYGHYESGADLLEDYRRSRGRGFGPEVRRRILLGAYVLSAGYYDAYYGKASGVRRLIKEEFRRAFEKSDAILLPTAPTTAFKLGEKLADPLQMYLADIFTVPANLAGLPAISVPSGRDRQGLPFGLQIIAPPGGESVLFKIGKDFAQNG